MENSKYVIFDILGVKQQNSSKNSFVFDKDAECIINNDKFISKILISSDISKATFYLHDSLKISKNNVSEIVNYLSLYLGNMMIALLKNSSLYSSASLKPTIRPSEVHLLETIIELNEYIKFSDSLASCSTLKNGNEILKKWVDDVKISNYTTRQDKYDILFLLLQGSNIVQKYMAMYAYLMSLVKEIYSEQRESQKQVVRYVSDNCSRVGIELITSLCTRPGAKPNEKEDQFTALRNKIAHPAGTKENVNMSNNYVNQLASIICCAIEDIPL